VIRKDDIQRQLQIAAEHHRAGRLREAETIYRRVLSTRPRNADALYLLGLVTQLTRRFAESAELFQRAVRENPKSVKYLVNLGLSLGGMGLGRTAEAIEALRRAVALDPNVPEAWSNLGNEFRNDLKFDQAIECYRKALRLKPDFADAQCNLGVALQETEPTLAGAIAAYETAIAMQGDFGMAHWNLGFALLLLGDYARGLPEYEWRFRTQTIVAPRNFRQPQWDGTDLAGQRILLHAEQGLGDTIHIARYVPMVAQRGGKVILECQPALPRLLGQLPGLTEIVAAGERLPPFDVHCPLMTLPLVFKTTLATIPANVPYLQPDPQLAGPWALRLPPDPKSPRIGLAWAGRPENKNDRNRSMRLDQFAPLSAIKHARFVTLQLGPAAAQARRPPAGLELIDHTNELHDFADTAALLANLDLIITVDTAVAHLAGALARPAWVLLPYMPDWRWMLDRTDSPWYPTLRLFRQKTRGDWAQVMERIQISLL
jgi:Flp pilus assembly protein TadD